MAHERIRLFERRQANKRGETTKEGAAHGRGVRGQGEMVWRSHLLLLQQKTLRRVEEVPEGIKQVEVEDRRHGWLGEFRYPNGKEVGHHPQNRHPQGQEEGGAGRGRGGQKKRQRGQGDGAAFLLPDTKG